MKLFSDLLAAAGCLLVAMGIAGSCIVVGAKLVRVGWGC